LNICVFASGAGSNFRAIIDAAKNGKISSDISLLITNNPGCGAEEIAKKNSISVEIINRKIFPDLSKDDYSGKFIKILRAYKIDFIVLAGYMKQVPDKVIEIYRDRIINIHPALLPLFGGKGMFGINVHKAVIKSGMKVSGITIHYVNEVYDEGKIIFQRCVDIANDETPDSLQKKIRLLEHEYYPHVINLFEENKIDIQEGRVIING
jgi:formyltetrahydrofolate-dependent phosphoribosylglycinamide formyltransferase